MNVEKNIKTLIVKKPLKLDCGKTIKDFNIEAYKPGKSKIKKLKKIIKLSANESPLGMSPRA